MSHQFKHSNSLTFRLTLLATSFLSAGSIQIHAQASERNNQFCSDSATIFENSAKIVLSKGTFKIITKKKMFKDLKEFEIEKVIDANGFIVGEKASLKFYQTNIEKPNRNDSGLATWKTIQAIIDNIPNSKWIGSGWKRLNNDYIYQVKSTRFEKIELVEEFGFFYINNKLVVGIFQCPLEDYYLWQPFFFGNNLGPCHIMVMEKHRPRFSGSTLEVMKF